MADDHSQRPYRSSESIARAGQSKPTASGNDPLAELARLIGQSDPFGEFSRENARRAGSAASRAEEAPQAYAPAAPAQAPQQDYYGRAPQTQNYQPKDYGQTAQEQAYAQQSYAQPAYAQETYSQDTYAQADYGHQAYAGQGQGGDGYPAHVPGYEPAEPFPGPPPYTAAAQEDYYDDVPPSRRRMGILVIAGVFALAIVGTAGAFGYRAIFGSSSSSAPPPVIKADAAPSKIVPASAKDAQSNKLITDRVTGPQGEKLVSREETPVDRPPLMPDNAAGVGVGAPPAALGSGVVSGEPKKIRTIAIHPDQNVLADAAGTASAMPAAAPTQAEPPVRQVQTRPAAAAPVPLAPQAAPPAAAPGSAPLSLNPNAQAARASAPTRTAAVAPAQTAAPGTAYAVQVASQRSEADAQTAYRQLLAKYSAQLSGRQNFIHRVDLGAKGTYYRAMVGPYANSNEASELCASLKAAGAQCFVQRN